MSTAGARPVLLLHGFGQTGRAWNGVIASLRGLDCHAPDLRGHGARSGARPIDSETLVDDVLEWASGLDKPLLVGYSMGGRLALRTALAVPSLISGLVLVSATAGIADPHERERRRMADSIQADRLENGDLESFEAHWQAQPVWDGDPGWVTDAAASMRATADPLGLAASLRGFGSGVVEPAWAELPDLSLPVLAVAGERDRAYVAHANRMGSLMQQARVEIVAGAGHSLPLEAPEALACVIEAFSRPPRPGGS